MTNDRMTLRDALTVYGAAALVLLAAACCAAGLWLGWADL